ncbi:MAG TPA: glycosyltransferase, partial [Acidimicrobiales bacterium]
MTRVVAIVPAKDRADSIADTVTALAAILDVDAVVVVDDGSSDATSNLASFAGARVVRLPANRGKGGAVRAGVDAEPDADVYLLVDADLGTTAGLVPALLAPVLAGDADMTIAVLPSAGGKGGFGSVKTLAGAGIERASGFRPRAPLSGQRAVRGELLRSFDFAERFGLETGLTIDAVRAGARVVEVDVAMDHRHTGRKLAGFRHRAGQGVDVVRALWPRLTTTSARVGLLVAAFVVATAVALWSGGRAEPDSVPLRASSTGGTVDRVVVFGFPGLSWDDIDGGLAPHVSDLVDRGAVAAMNVRTRSRHPSTVEAYASLGAGGRMETGREAGHAYGARTTVEGGTAAEALARRVGREPDGDVVVVGAPATAIRNRQEPDAVPGGLGSALRDAGLRTGVVGNADIGNPAVDIGAVRRPAAIAVMDRNGSVDAGEVDRGLLAGSALAPFGYRADHEQVLAALRDAVAEADVVVVDAGDVDRAILFASVAAPAVASDVRADAVRSTDALLGRVVADLPADTLVVVAAVTPPGTEWRLAPVVVTGPGVASGYLHSPSTRRLGVVTLADLAPTVLDALGVAVPDQMTGHPLRAHAGTVDLGRLSEMDRDAAFREGIYRPVTITYVVVQVLLYLAALFAFWRFGGAGVAGRALRHAVLAVSAYPLATYLLRAVPDVAEAGAFSIALLLALDALTVVVATRATRHPLSPLTWILGVTIAVIAADVATGARLQASSMLGYSLHTAGRYTGLGNTAFAVLATATLLLAAAHVHYAPRRREALVAVALLFAFVVVVDGAPALGADVGGILTLVPAFG